MDYPDKANHLLQLVLDNLVDGILVLTSPQRMLYATATAHAICRQLPWDDGEQLPRELQRVCKALIDSQSLYHDRPVIIESEVSTPETTFRVQAKWLYLDTVEHPCILLRLQDQTKSAQGLAITETEQWHLTPREAEVWLLRRSGRSRKEIAAALCITLDTVKKHLKNIQCKRQPIAYSDIAGDRVS